MLLGVKIGEGRAKRERASPDCFARTSSDKSFADRLSHNCRHKDRADQSASAYPWLTTGFAFRFSALQFPHVTSSDDAFNHLFGHLGHMRIDWHFFDGARKAGVPIRPQAFTAYAISREDELRRHVVVNRQSINCRQETPASYHQA